MQQKKSGGMMRKYIVKKIKMTSEVSKTCQAYRKNVVVKMATTSYMYCCNQEGCFLATGCRVKKNKHNNAKYRHQTAIS